jgi:SAM-dependent methyltransferase
VHGDNTWLARNAEIQTNTAKVGQTYFYAMVEAWCKRNNLLMIDIGGGIDSPNGYVSVDMHDAQVVANLDDEWPFDDKSVGYIRAFDIIEHLKSPIHTMSEIHRVLVPGGYCSILVPSTDGRGAFQDPTHISFWNENSFWYYTDQRYARYIRNDSIRFLDIFLHTFFPSEWHVSNNISYVRADLMALKEEVAYHGVRKI